MRRTAMVGCLLLLACGGGSTGASSATATAATSEPGSEGASASEGASESESESAPAGAPYELHEWGVVDVPAGGTAVEIAAGAGEPQRPISVRKPVVYAHLLDGAVEQTFALRVTLGAGSFVEHAPPGNELGTTLEWPTVVARSAHCATPAGGAAGTSRRMPRAACAAADGICEVMELPRYDAASAACLEVDGTQTGLLFYRGQAPSVALPLAATRAADGTATVTVSAAMTGAPGGILRISTRMSGPWPTGRVVISRAAFPAAGASVTLPVGTEVVTRAQGIAELRASLATLGLTTDEADAFLAGWADELFGPDTGTAREESRDLPARGRFAPPDGPRLQDVVLYFLPASAVDGIATLTPTPAPRAVRRAFLVRIDLGPVATG